MGPGRWALSPLECSACQECFCMPWATWYQCDQVVYVNSMITENAKFLFWEVGVWVAEVGHKGLQAYVRSSVKNPERPLGPTSLAGTALLLLSHIIGGRMKGVCATPLGEDTWNLAPGFSWTLSHEPFPFSDFNLFLFTIISRNHEYSNFSESCEFF